MENLTQRGMRRKCVWPLPARRPEGLAEHYQEGGFPRFVPGMGSGSWLRRSACGRICLTKSAAFFSTCEILRLPGVTTPTRLPRCALTRRMPSARSAVVAHDNRAVVGVEPAVVQQMHGEVDVGALLLRLDDAYRALAPDRLCERGRDLMRQEVAEVNRDLGAVRLEGAEAELLALGLGRIVGRRRDPRREVFDREDVVVGGQNAVAQRDEVEPFPASSLERAVVEVEAVDVDQCAQGSMDHVRGKARASEEAPRHAVENRMGYRSDTLRHGWCIVKLTVQRLYAAVIVYACQ